MLLGGLIGINDTFFKSRGIPPSGFDAWSNGSYQISLSNRPNGFPDNVYLYGVMLVFGSGDFKAQIYIPDDMQHVLVRAKYKDEIREWKVIV